ncbi:unnamed protein product [Moneuplotes crassus]|uniref:Uncharacterized protein n=1 Tax=Euplotes crassus TaxID=5936 RepID=A0AAD1USE4_EUPCR|nr:unnamed protein product [Moneuplotes crassus]
MNGTFVKKFLDFGSCRWMKTGLKGRMESWKKGSFCDLSKKVESNF